MNEELLTRRSTYSAPLWSSDFFILRHVRRFVHRQIANIQPQATLLDAGCGEQPFREAVQRAGARYTSLDVIQNRRRTVDVVGPLHQTSFPDGQFDAVLLTEVLEHVADLDTTFRELRRILKADGKVIVTIPFLYPLHELPHDYSRLTPGGVSWLAERHGFAVEELTARGDAIEAAATIWMNAWASAGSRLNPPVRQVATLGRLVLNTLTNIIAITASGLFGPLLRGSAYLSTTCVLVKRQ